MNIIWVLIVMGGIIAMLGTDPDGALKAMLSGSDAAVKLALTLLASYGFWLGLFAILDKTGVADFLAKLMRPLIKKLFKDTDERTEKYITMNISANLLGLGNASTAMGVSAVNAMYKGQKHANTNMIMLTVISATSLQLIPSTVIGMRIAHGSNAPTAFLLPCIAATVLSTAVGIMLVKLFSRIFGDQPKEKKPLMRDVKGKVRT